MLAIYQLDTPKKVEYVLCDKLDQFWVTRNRLLLNIKNITIPNFTVQFTDNYYSRLAKSIVYIIILMHLKQYYGSKSIKELSLKPKKYWEIQNQSYPQITLYLKKIDMESIQKTDFMESLQSIKLQANRNTPEDEIIAICIYAMGLDENSQDYVKTSNQQYGQFVDENKQNNIKFNLELVEEI